MKKLFAILIPLVILALIVYGVYHSHGSSEGSAGNFTIPTIGQAATTTSVFSPLIQTTNTTSSGTTATAPQPAKPAQTNNSSSVRSVPVVPQQNGLGIYENSSLHFSLILNPHVVAHDYDEGYGAHTITFEDPDSSQEFQIFAAPYTDTQVTAERFKMDEPSGVFDQPTDVIIDGVRGTMFYSTNTAMGDTREVWFIRGAYLYEVTTEKSSDTWLAGIMATWKFI